MLNKQNNVKQIFIKTFIVFVIIFVIIFVFSQNALKSQKNRLNSNLEESIKINDKIVEIDKNNEHYSEEYNSILENNQQYY